jgi:endoglucanase
MRYNGSLDPQQATTPMSTPRFLASAAPLPHTRVVVAGGLSSLDAAQPLATAEQFDVVNSSWSPVAPMPSGRYGAVAAALPDGRVLIAGGRTATGATASTLLLSPPPLPTPNIGITVNQDAADGVFGGPSAALRVGDTLEAWAAATSASTFTTHWQRCLQTCVDVPSSQNDSYWDGARYTVTDADVGATLRVVVTASNADATSTKVSRNLGPVTSPGFHLTLTDQPAFFFRRLLPTGFSPTLSIPVYRDDAAGPASVSYTLSEPGAPPHPAFPTIQGTLQFASGVHTQSIPVTIIDHGRPILAPELEISLGTGSPDPVVAPSSSLIDLRQAGDDWTRDPSNPLALRTPSAATDPLTGADLFVDRTGTPAAKQANAWRTSQPAKAALLDQIVNEPNTERYGQWSGPYPGGRVRNYLKRVDQQQPGSVPLLATYRIVRGHCGGWSDSPPDAAAYHAWITSLAEGIGTHPAVLFLEMDSIITAPQCLSKHGISVRMQELHDAINVLSNCPHLVTYLDAGAADALRPRTAAHLLERAGIKEIEGFFLNSTHFDWTKNEIRYGERISRLTGGKHFVVNTAENGQGPQRTAHPARQGAEVICNPKNRGLGPKPTTHTGYKNVDAFAWIAHPGVSGGPCTRGAPPIGVFWPAKALSLVRHADYRVR